MKKKFFVSLLVICVVFIVLIFTLPLFIDVNHYKGVIIEKAQKALQKKIELGNLKLNLIGGVGVSTNEVKIYEGLSDSSKVFFSCDAFTIRVKILPLLSKKIEVSKIYFDKPYVSVIRDKNGDFNFMPAPTQRVKAAKRILSPEVEKGKTLPKRIPPAIPAPVPGPERQERKNPQFELGSLIINDGHVVFIDHMMKEKVTIDLSNLDATIAGVRVGGRINIKMAGELNKTGSIAFSATVGAIPAGFDILSHLDKLSFTINGNIDNCDITPLMSYVSSSDDIPKIKGPVSLTFLLKGKHDDIYIKSKTDMTNASVLYQDLFEKTKGKALTSNLEGRIKESKDIAIDQLHLLYGDTKLSVQGSVNDFNVQEKMRLDLNVNGKIMMKDLISLKELKGYSPTGAINVKLDVKGEVAGTKKLDTQGFIQCDQVRFATPLNPSVHAVLNGRLKIHAERIDFEEVQVTVEKSKLFMNGFIDGFDAPRAEFDVKVKECYLEEIMLFLPEKNASSQNRPRVIPRGEKVVTPEASPSKKVEITNRSEAPVVMAERPTALSSDQKLFEKMDVKARFHADRLIYKKNDIKDVNAQMLIKNGILTINPFNLVGFDGTGEGQVVYHAASPLNEFKMKAQLKDVDIHDILKKNSKLGDVLYGRLDAVLDLTGSGATEAQIKDNVNGNGKLHIREGRFKSFNLLENLSVISGIVGLNLPDIKDTSFKDLTLTLTITNGVCRTNDLKMKTQYFDLFGSGYFTLNNQIRYDLDVVFSEAFTKRLGSGKLQRALTRSDGRISMPFLITGALDGPPKFTPNWGNILQREAVQLLSDKVFGKEEKKETVPGQPPSTKDTLKGMLMDVISDSLENKSTQEQ
ncbi:MAG: AsmA family protein [Candidatus Ancaeobacter aquaticus]|nr:AsmA family protein [Candidatus Ancaeobacter aquaticus]